MIVERNHTDVFRVKLPNIGRVTGCTIDHDGSGIGSDWLLESVLIREEKSGTEYSFTSNVWLDKRNERRVSLLVNDAEAAKLGLQAPSTPMLTRANSEEAEKTTLGSESVETGDGGGKPNLKIEVPSSIDTSAPPTAASRQRNICISVVTGSEKGSGTDANIFATLVASGGRTEEQKLATSREHRDKCRCMLHV